ncbi:hypothetical protein TNCV_2786391 [Trichonephila clavipes]|nr:hypothetical protein TNCV_2786391 [Trichonephila clavipes]
MTKVDRFRSKEILVSGGKVLGSCICLYVFHLGIVSRQCYEDEIVESYVRVFWVLWRFSDNISIEYVWDDLGKAISQRKSLPKAPKELKVPFLEKKWALLPKTAIETLINSMTARCEACPAFQSGHIHIRRMFPEKIALSPIHEFTLLI